MLWRTGGRRTATANHKTQAAHLSSDAWLQGEIILLHSLRQRVQPEQSLSSFGQSGVQQNVSFPDVVYKRAVLLQRALETKGHREQSQQLASTSRDQQRSMQTTLARELATAPARPQLARGTLDTGGCQPSSAL
eukprot:CAMPEP_0204351132 /NCGR_PEP_ID=MMETSP0469-20131031/30878_1 /ASSEMBLY_ACC=CAM_ASM_000384 /TAXON_ID=2969 /ORGANISM="Oxyrrhis marina" /LENGTH=133 /DNA_ID=CAMNT_0051337619 /DNA_START=51 /DNA_END=452 /DNA_ORIENTATION=+